MERVVVTVVVVAVYQNENELEVLMDGEIRNDIGIKFVLAASIKIHFFCVVLFFICTLWVVFWLLDTDVIDISFLIYFVGYIDNFVYDEKNPLGRNCRKAYPLMYETSSCLRPAMNIYIWGSQLLASGCTINVLLSHLDLQLNNIRLF
mmetsp:Transcript_21673/g.31938  ORF Transcript_21673/g.31938 Transcript_21673/m.31938 type:complete len:148 (-) Transcript_21673:12-455(-)